MGYAGCFPGCLLRNFPMLCRLAQQRARAFGMYRLFMRVQAYPSLSYRKCVRSSAQVLSIASLDWLGVLRSPAKETRP